MRSLFQATLQNSKIRTGECAASVRARSLVFIELKVKTLNKGTVKFYNADRGYGFIAPDAGGNDVFVHATALERAGISIIREGQKVSFETKPDRRSGKDAVSDIRLD